MLFLRIDNNEDFFDILLKVSEKENITSAIILSGIGMLKDFEIGYFNIEKKQYEIAFFEVPYELLSLTGNISLKDDKIFPHLHVALAGSDKNVIGGHLFKARVCNTVELFIKIIQFELIREKREFFRPLNWRGEQ